MNHLTSKIRNNWERKSQAITINSVKARVFRFAARRKIHTFLCVVRRVNEYIAGAQYGQTRHDKIKLWFLSSRRKEERRKKKTRTEQHFSVDDKPYSSILCHELRFSVNSFTAKSEKERNLISVIAFTHLSLWTTRGRSKIRAVFLGLPQNSLIVKFSAFDCVFMGV